MNERRTMPGLAALALAGAALLAVAADPANAVPPKPPVARETGAGRPAQTIRVYSAERRGYVVLAKVMRSDEEWKKELTPEQYRVTRRKGTEAAFTGKYWNSREKGVYRCVSCGSDLFDSKTKFDSGTGWPSFYQPIARENVGTERDSSLGMVREEVHCSRCGAHLGHIFHDGPRPTGLRYCINSAALRFEKEKE